MPHVILCLGANMEPRHKNLQRALTLISEVFYGIPRVSSIYETQSHSGYGAAYLNQVVKGYLRIPLKDFEVYAKHVEYVLGRTPDSKRMGQIPADIDLVVADGMVIRAFDFSAPHFRIGYDELEVQ